MLDFPLQGLKLVLTSRMEEWVTLSLTQISATPLVNNRQRVNYSTLLRKAWCYVWGGPTWYTFCFHSICPLTTASSSSAGIDLLPCPASAGTGDSDKQWESFQNCPIPIGCNTYSEQCIFQENTDALSFMQMEERGGRSYHLEERTSAEKETCSYKKRCEKNWNMLTMNLTF